MKHKLIHTLLTAMLALVASMPTHAGTAYYTHETVEGRNKICFYDYLGDAYAITIKSYKLCPLSIRV